MSKHSAKEGSINGFLTMSLEAGNIKNLCSGQVGIYYQKEDLLTILKSKEKINPKAIYIVEVKVCKDVIIPINEQSFGIRGNKNTPVINKELLEEILESEAQVA